MRRPQVSRFTQDKERMDTSAGRKTRGGVEKVKYLLGMKRGSRVGKK